jgi:hypothetical protein
MADEREIENDPSADEEARRRRRSEQLRECIAHPEVGPPSSPHEFTERSVHEERAKLGDAADEGADVDCE